jgi:hypothetical protein
MARGQLSLRTEMVKLLIVFLIPPQELFFTAIYADNYPATGPIKRNVAGINRI